MQKVIRGIALERGRRKKKEPEGFGRFVNFTIRLAAGAANSFRVDDSALRTRSFSLREFCPQLFVNNNNFVGVTLENCGN